MIYDILISEGRAREIKSLILGIYRGSKRENVRKLLNIIVTKLMFFRIVVACPINIWVDR